ncbi:MAG: hypothetical protein ABIJ04_12405 [Bacteroidota bacterium]
MSILLILLAQTKSDATIEILLLLLVAAIIGYITAWLYYRSIYAKRIKAIESERDEALLHTTQRKPSLDYKSFGGASGAEKDDLKIIKGIGPFIEERLHALDIFTFRQISNFTEQDIAAVRDAIEYFEGRIERDDWVGQAKELVHSKDKRTSN